MDTSLPPPRGNTEEEMTCAEVCGLPPTHPPTHPLTHSSSSFKSPSPPLPTYPLASSSSFNPPSPSLPTYP